MSSSTPHRRRPTKGVNPGREAAVRALFRVHDGERAESALAAEAPPPGRDRALAWHLVSGTLQHQRELDWLITSVSKRPLSSLDTKVHWLLRVALYELRHGKAPDRAVVHQAVELTKRVGARRATGFVNAVLRKQRQVGDIPLRVALNHPDWLLDRWELRMGTEAAHRWARANNSPAPLCLAHNGRQPELASTFRDAGFELEQAMAAGQPVPEMSVLQGPTGPVSELPGAAEGLWWVQDPAAAAVADLVECEPGWTVLDACAAPGGKTFRLANAGAQLVAVDISERRLSTLHEGLSRLELQARCLSHDWLEGPIPELGTVDAVLVDAPCSGLGTTRRHPEIRWRRNEADLQRNAQQQLSILAAASCHLRAGGVLVYAVCSGEPEEGEQIVARFLEQTDGFRHDRGWSSAPPSQDEDAFWAARLIRG